MPRGSPPEPQELGPRLTAVSADPGTETTARPAASPAPRTADGRLSPFARRLALILAGGVVLRVLYTVLAAPWPPKGLDDQVYYHLQPALLAHGRGFIEPVFAIVGRSIQTAEHPPLYPLVLAVVAKFGGSGALVQRLAGTVFGAGTILAVGLLGRRAAGERVGLLAAALAAVYPILITADGALMSETLYGVLVAACLLAGWRLYERPTMRGALLLGLLAGLAALTRGEGALLLVLLLIPLRRIPGGMRLTAGAVVALLVVLAPWTIRNAIVFHRFVAVSNDTGAVFGGANCDPTYYGSNLGGWSYLCNHPPPGDEGKTSAAEQSAGLRYAAHHLRRLPIVLAARLERVWGFRHPFQPNSGRAAWAQGAGQLMYYLLLAPAIWGFLLLRRRRGITWPLSSAFVLVSVISAIGYGFLRFREPADIALVVLAAVGLDELARRRRRGQAGHTPTPLPG